MIRKPCCNAGDLLHEAGHLAVTPGAIRHTVSDDLGDATSAGIEVEAIAWSYAAAIFLCIDPGIVFHEHGYGGRSAGLRYSFQLGVFPGAAGLSRRGMTRVGGSPAADTAEPVYPSMRRWLAD